MRSASNDNCRQLSSQNQRVGGSIPSRRTISAGHPCRSGAGQDLGDLNFEAVFCSGAHVDIGVGVMARVEPDRVAAGGGLEAGAVVDNDVGGGDRFGGRFLSWRTGLVVRSSGPGFPARWAGPGGAAGHPFAAAGGGTMGCAVHWPVGSITKGRPRHSGGHDLHDPRRPGKSQGWCSCHPRPML
jgi:hypothetical protein